MHCSSLDIRATLDRCRSCSNAPPTSPNHDAKPAAPRHVALCPAHQPQDVTAVCRQAHWLSAHLKHLLYALTHDGSNQLLRRLVCAVGGPHGQTAMLRRQPLYCRQHSLRRRGSRV